LGCGGLVAYPTETLYALGVDALNPSALTRVFKVKGRDPLKALTVIVDCRGSLRLLTPDVPSIAEKLMEQFWPGPLTILLQALSEVPASLTAGTGKVGIRVPASAVARELSAVTGRPLTATSANPSGRGGFTSAAEVAAALGGGLDLVMDGGRTPGGSESTILDVTVFPPLLVREGVLSRERLEDYLSLKLPADRFR
jgi:L-threonylcarbamoyladenylate synthase